MGRWIRWTVLALVVVIVTGTVILVVTVRPGLQDDAQEVRRTWKPLLQPLAARYTALGRRRDGAGGGGQRRPGPDQGAQARAERLAAARRDERRRGPVPTANQLEGLASRIRATAAGSARLRPSGADRGDRGVRRGQGAPGPVARTTTPCCATSGTGMARCAASSRTSTATTRIRRSSSRPPRRT